MPPLYLHPSNTEVLHKILALKDENGKPLMSSADRDILSLIARFPNETGNFMSDKALLGELGRTTIVTLRTHLKYLHGIGVIERYNEDKTFKGKTVSVTVRKLRDPDPDTNMTLTEFCARVLQMGQYKYALVNFPYRGYLSFDSETKFANNPDKFCQNHDVKFGSCIGEKDMSDKKEKKETPPKFPPLDDLSPASRTTMDGLDGRPSGEGESPRERQSQNSSKVKGELPGDPLVKKRKRGKPKTEKERVVEANKARAKGHLVSPIGKKNSTRGRRLKPSQARDIGETGSVTIPQLWKAYCKIFEEAFGLEAILPSVMADSRENVTMHFDDMRQRMLDVSGYEPTYRDLYEYLKWFHDPTRLKALIPTGARTGNKGYVHPKQLAGKVHLKNFYDQVLSRKSKGDEASARVTSQREKTSFVQDAYDHIRRAQGNNLEMAYCIVNYGYVIFAEWLNDYNGLNGSACKKKIIDIFRESVHRADDPEAAIRFLSDAWGNTAANAALFPSEVWDDWEGTCTDIMSLIKSEQ